MLRGCIAACLGLALTPIVCAALLWAAIMLYANPRVGDGEHFPVPTWPIDR